MWRQFALWNGTKRRLSYRRPCASWSIATKLENFRSSQPISLTEGRNFFKNTCFLLPWVAFSLSAHDFQCIPPSEFVDWEIIKVFIICLQQYNLDNDQHTSTTNTTEFTVLRSPLACRRSLRCHDIIFNKKKTILDK